MANDYVLQLPELEDDQILATDDTGDELLHFAVSWSGKTVRVRYPTFGKWESFCKDVLAILDGIGNGLGQIDIDDARDDPEEWQDLCGRFLFLKNVYPKIQTAFFKYLRPTVDGLDEKQSRAWLESNAPLDSVVRMFCALLAPQQMLKKNVKFALNLICPGSQDQLSTPISTNNGAGPKSELTEAQSSPFGSFY